MKCPCSSETWKGGITIAKARASTPQSTRLRRSKSLVRCGVSGVDMRISESRFPDRLAAPRHSRNTGSSVKPPESCVPWKLSFQVSHPAARARFSLDALGPRRRRRARDDSGVWIAHLSSHLREGDLVYKRVKDSCDYTSMSRPTTPEAAFAQTAPAETASSGVPGRRLAPEIGDHCTAESGRWLPSGHCRAAAAHPRHLPAHRNRADAELRPRHGVLCR